MLRTGLALASLFVVAGWSRAASPNPADLEVPAEIQVKSRVLVQQLGSDDFPEREDAQQQLAALGRLARPALLAGVTSSPNPEVRLRCSQLLPNATVLDIKAQLETFLADTKGQYEHDLPGWKTFRAVVCREWAFCNQVIWTDRSLEKAAREVFAELVAVPANRRLLLAIDGSRLELTELVVARRQELYNERYPRRGEVSSRDPTLEEMAALLFADSRVGSQYLPRRGSINFLMSASGFASAARGTDEKGRVYRAIAVAWLNSRNDPREMAQAMTIASNLDLSDQACALAARLLAMPGVATLPRGRAASNLVTLGNKKHIRLLEKALADTFVVDSVRVATLPDEPEPTACEVQVRDLALVVSITLTNQKPEDYGFTDRFSGNPGYDNQSFSSKRYYFPDDATRTKALAKWAAWRKAHADE